MNNTGDTKDATTNNEQQDEIMIEPTIKTTKFKNPKHSPRTRLQCGCGCKSKLDIFADGEGAEIGGVHASKEFWVKFIGQLFESRS
jgi:hypothetical protein